MSFASWLRGWRTAVECRWALSRSRRQRPPTPARLPARTRPGLEVLEDRLAPANIVLLASFTGSNGANPLSGLIADSGGNLFGTTGLGGPNNDGTVFEVKANSNTITTLASFTGGNGGAFPFAGLIADSSGNLFGTTRLG